MIVANLSIGVANIFYNAYLPLLVASSEDLQPYLDSTHPDYKVSTPEETADAIEEVMSKISSYGPAFGYLGQLTDLVLSLGMIMFMSDSTRATQLVILKSGIWLLVFMLFSASRLKTRPGAPLPKGSSYLTQGFKDTGKTMSLCWNRLHQMRRFLLAYFIYSDGTSTLAGSATIFALVELNMSTTEVMMALVLISLVAPLGCIFWLWLESKFHLHVKTMILLNLFIFCLLPIYGLIGMTSKMEFYALGLVYAMVTGAEQAFTRGAFAEMIPHGHESEFFAFYEVTDKGTAWLGPVVVGLVNEFTGSFRLGFFSIIFFYVIGGAILWFGCKIDEGIQEKLTYENEEAATESGTMKSIAEGSEDIEAS